MLRGDDEVLEVDDDLGDVLLDALDGRELVEDAVDLDARDRGTGDRGQQSTAERVAEGVAEARLQRLDDEPGAESSTTSSDRVGRCAMSTVVSFPRPTAI